MSNRKERKRARLLLGRLERQSKTARQPRIIDWDVNALKTAAHYHWMGDYRKAGSVFFPLMNKLIQEPLKGTKEYEDGERKQEISLTEQEKAEALGVFVEDRCTITFEDLFSAGEPTQNAPEPERDKDGYIINEWPELEEWLIR